MEYLTLEYISAMLRESDAQIRSRNRNKNMYCVEGEIFTGKPSTMVAGSFSGNVGSKRRSRKGRTTILPNGTRKYGTYNSPEASWYRVSQ